MTTSLIASGLPIIFSGSDSDLDDLSGTEQDEIEDLLFDKEAIKGKPPTTYESKDSVLDAVSRITPK
ncbi:hypothetical protein TNCT_601561 [Trichonephila clavata]|uniref:Uncharacterized protein n=1 Tax=Trichonephila clavata TaxID=2740835 RepID=A0A8X6F2E2_TRICU|nr:hypothetical protein TNCT_601561 [Trichonephila clavata]